MTHRKEHPLACRRVCIDGLSGEVVKVVDWLDRLENCGYLLRPGNPVGTVFRARIRRFGLHESGAVLCRSRVGFRLVHHDEMPAYDPVPVGVIS